MFKRSKKKSSSGQESSSQVVPTIYHAFRPLATLTWVFGLLPVRNVVRVQHVPYGSLNYCCSALSIIISMLMLSSIVAVIVVMIQNQIHITEYPFLKQVLIGLAMNRVMHAMVQYWLVRWKCRDICDLFLRIHKYDEWVKTHTVMDPINHVLRKRAWHILLFIFFYVTFLWVSYYMSRHFFMTQSQVSVVSELIFFLLLLFICILPIIPTVHVLFLGKSICLRLHQVNDSVIQLVSVLPSSMPENPLPKDYTCIEMTETHSDTLSKALGCYTEMGDVVSAVGDLYGLCLVVNFLSFLIQIVTGLALAFYVSIVVQMYIFADTLISVVLVVWTCHSLQKIPHESTLALPHLCKVKLIGLASDVRLQVQELIHRMMGPSMQISAANFFSINRGLVTSVAAAVVTYLIVLAQFKISEIIVPASTAEYDNETFITTPEPEFGGIGGILGDHDITNYALNRRLPVSPRMHYFPLNMSYLIPVGPGSWNESGDYIDNDYNHNYNEPCVCPPSICVCGDNYTLGLQLATKNMP